LKIKSIVLLITYGFLGSLGLTLIKKGFNNAGNFLNSIKSPVFITGFCLYGLSFILWLKILKDNELSYAFPIASATLFIFVTLFSIFVINERFNFMRIVGMVFIVIGIFFVAKG
jgi:multidrug transporter EmrE-like cation transporter